EGDGADGRRDLPLPGPIVVLVLFVAGSLGWDVPATVVVRGVVIVVVAGSLVVVHVAGVVVRHHVGEVVVPVRVPRAGLERVLLQGRVAARGAVAVQRSGVTAVDTVAVLRGGERVGRPDPGRVGVRLACQCSRGGSCGARTSDARRSTGCAHPGTR